MMSNAFPMAFDNGRYKRTGIINEGPYSNIYEVTDRETAERQVLKVLKLNNGDPAIRQALFDKEVLSLTKLRHPSVVELKRHFTDADTGLLCIALEHIPRALPLRLLIENVQARTTDKKDLLWSLDVLERLIRGLEKAHQLDIVHRDFNPNNIVLSHNGNGDVKIIDFGIAKLLDQFGETHVSLQTFMTYPYVSPEQTSNEDLNIEHDYFTYGLVMLGLLTWRLPRERRLLKENDINAMLESLPTYVADSLYASKLSDLVRALTSAERHQRPRPAQIRQLLQEVRVGSGERPALGLIVPNGTRQKMIEAGFHSAGAFFSDLNQGTVAYYRESLQPTRRINVQFFGRNTWLLTRTDDQNQEQLVAVDAKRLGADELRRRMNAYPCGYRLDEGPGNAKVLMDDLFERQRIDTRAEQNESKRRDHFKLSQRILEIEEDNAKHMTLIYDDLDTKTNPGFYRLTVRGILNLKAEGEQEVHVDTQQISSVIGDLDPESAFAVGVAKRARRATPAATLEDDPSTRTKQRVFGTFHSFQPKSQTLILKKTRNVGLPKSGHVSHIDQGVLKSIERQRDALVTFIKDRAVNPFLPDRLLAPGMSNSIGTQQPVELIQTLKPADVIRKILSRAMAAQDLFLLQGPPGTGKTTFIAELITQLLQQDRRARILLTAQPNSAVEHAMQEFRRLTNRTHRSLLLTRDNNELDDSFRTWADGVVQKSRASSERTLLAVEAGKRDRVAAILDNWRVRLPRAFDAHIDFVRSAQVYGTTCVKIPVLTDRMNNEAFDWVIIDEAAKALDTEILMALVEGKRFILVGDHKQLPPYLDQKTREQLETSDFSPEEIATTLFERLFRKLPIQNRETLRTQFRMHQSIGQFVSDLFYDGILEHGTPDEDRELPLPLVQRSTHRVVWLNTNFPETHVRPGYYNAGEVTRIHKMLQGLNQEAKAINRHYTVSVISPYRAQVSILDEKIAPAASYWTNLEIVVATIDSFQGRQSDIVFYSLVRTSSNNLEFVADKQRTNVACSRAKRLLVILGHADVLKQEPVFGKALGLIPDGNILGRTP